MIAGLIEGIVITISALCTSYGLFLLCHSILRRLSMQVRRERHHRDTQEARGRMNNIGIAPREEERDEDKKWYENGYDFLYRQLELFLKSTIDNFGPSTVRSFMIWNMALFIFMSVLIYFETNSIQYSIIFGSVCIVIVLLVYTIKWRTRAIRGGYELAEVTGILSSKYKVSRGNMRIAIKETCAETQSIMIRKLLLNIIREEMVYKDPEELKRAIEEFVFSIRTSFATQLGLLIMKSLINSENVESTLMNIDRQIHKNIDMLQDEGDSSSEVLQLSWLHVVMFPAVTIFMVIFMGFESTMHYQLEDEGGRAMFIVIIVTIVFSLFMAIWFKKPPNDY